MASLRHFCRPSLPKCYLQPRPLSPYHFSTPKPRRPVAGPPPRCHCLSSSTTSSSTATPVDRAEEKNKRKASGRRDGVCVNIRVDHQVEFGEHVAILGSSKELGSWKKRVPMEWNPDGWVAELQLRGGEAVEFKFVIVPKDGKGKIWEDGENRILQLPERGMFDLLCCWNKTNESLNLSGSVQDAETEELDSEEGGDGSLIGERVLDVQAEPSPFVEQWQGRMVSFMRSNEHRSRETERRWVTDGLDGMALKLVEGDRSARNWWRKVC